MKSTMLTTACAALAIVCSSTAFADSGGVAQRVVAPPPAPEVQHTALFSLFHTGNPLTAATGGITPYHTDSVVCPASAGSCTLLLSSMVEIGGGTGDEWAIDVSVDGSPVDSGPYQGVQISGYVIGNWSNSVSVTPGHHKVVYSVYLNDDATIYTWSTNTTVMKP